MARPRQPASVHAINGTMRASVKARAETELQVDAGPVGEPPEWLGEDGKQEWRRLASHEQFSQVLSPLYYGGLVHYCFLHDKNTRAMQGGEKMTATETQALLSLRMQMCVTIASSSKARMPAAKPAADEWARFDKKKA